MDNMTKETLEEIERIRKRGYTIEQAIEILKATELNYIATALYHERTGFSVATILEEINLQLEKITDTMTIGDTTITDVLDDIESALNDLIEK